ncbi:MAG: hypothetical protein D6801_03165 [Alphaproteobacteria bacterium]|nr:MAG: hypothetical protein D6801_03165 [Alphaproteobacteria bacterium]
MSPPPWASWAEARRARPGRIFLARARPTLQNPGMSNTTAIVLGLTVLAFFGYDGYAHDWAVSLFLGKKMFEFLDWLAFWR